MMSGSRSALKIPLSFRRASAMIKGVKMKSVSGAPKGRLSHPESVDHRQMGLRHRWGIVSFVTIAAFLSAGAMAPPPTQQINEMIQGINMAEKESRSQFKANMQALISTVNTATQSITEQRHAVANEQYLARIENTIKNRLKKLNQSVPIRSSAGSPLASIVASASAMRKSAENAQDIAERLYDEMAMTKFSDERLSRINSVPLIKMIEYTDDDGHTQEMADPTFRSAFRHGVFPVDGSAINPARIRDAETTPDGYQEDVRLAMQAMLDPSPPAPLTDEALKSRVGTQYEARRRARTAQMQVSWNTLLRRLGDNAATQPVPKYIDHIWYEVLGYPGKAEDIRSMDHHPDDDTNHPPGVAIVPDRSGGYQRRISAAGIREVQNKQYTHYRDFSAELSNMNDPIGPMRERAEMQRLKLRELRRELDWIQEMATNLAVQNVTMIEQAHSGRLERFYQEAMEVASQ